MKYFNHQIPESESTYLTFSLSTTQINMVMGRCAEQTEKMMPFITGEIAFRQDVGKLVLGIKKFEFDFWV